MDHRIIARLTPPFEAEVHDPGYIMAYPPGVRENGGQYSHASLWLAWALAKQGDGDRADCFCPGAYISSDIAIKNGQEYGCRIVQPIT